MKTYSIAIDGPVASGKGTLAVGLAKQLHILWINTGAMYRALALACQRQKIDTNNQQAVLSVLERCTIDLRKKYKDLGEVLVYLDGNDVTHSLYTDAIDKLVPIVAAIPTVRKEMVRRQQTIAQGNSVVMEGRDIGTVVLPFADVKIYLSASLSERARRRQEQLQNRGTTKDISEVKADIQLRDKLDKEREESPLLRAKDAIVLDTTNLSIEETIEKVVSLLQEKGII